MKVVDILARRSYGMSPAGKGRRPGPSRSAERFFCLGAPRVFNRRMDRAQGDESRSEASEADLLTRPRLGADELRASLEAVRVAQAAARARARSETRWARAMAVGALMLVGATAWAAAHRPGRAHPAASGPSVTSAATPPVQAISTPPAQGIATPPQAVAAPREAAAAERPAPPEVVAPTERSGRAVPRDDGAERAACDAAFSQRSWPAVATTCAAAFEARPDSALAMRVAQAEHRRGLIAVAAGWARKALALDAELPEAFVIVAHAEAGAGRSGSAAEAYRRYLALAPRGWHAAEARRALRAER
jgi:hypothetical protein